MKTNLAHHVNFEASNAQLYMPASQIIVSTNHWRVIYLPAALPPATLHGRKRRNQIVQVNVPVVLL